jgi:hypothetical protein
METTMKNGFAGAIDLIKFGQELASKRSHRTDKKEPKKDPDLLALMEQKRREYLALKTFVEEQGKLNKPEDKKTESIFNVKNIALFLIATTPITGPLYVAWFRLMLG